MKEGWTYKKLGEACEILNGFAFKSSNYVPEGVRVIRITNVQKGYVEDNDPKYYPYETKDELSRYLLKEGDMLLSLTGNVGRVAILGKSFLPAYLNQRVACIRVRKGVELDLSFLFHLLYSQKFEDDCIKSSNGAAQLNMSTVWLASYLIPVPPLSEQQSIVDYLDSAFAKIDAMKANAEKALGEAKALFQASLKEMLEPKEGWEESELKDIVDEKCPISYGIVQQGDHVEGGIPVVRPVDLNRKYITANGLKCTTESISSSYKRTILRGDEILLGVRGTTGIIGIATEELNGCNVNRGVVPLFFKDTICRDFIFYEMLSPAIQAVFAEKTTGATLKQINIKDLRTIVFSYPIIEIQQSIVATLDSLKSKVDRLQANYDKISQECDALKQAILRQVFE
jgi:type I restriction enzyme S subunit